MDSSHSDHRITQLLQRSAKGDSSAEDELFRAVYDELRQIASGFLRSEHVGHSWQTNDLLNEVAIKLIRNGSLQKSTNRSYFFAAVARAMRQLLVDHARSRRAQKRPQGRVPIDDILESLEQETHLEILDLDIALEQLKTLDQRKHDVVHLRFFGGLKFKEIAEYLDVSVATVERDWQFSQAWLRSVMADDRKRS